MNVSDSCPMKEFSFIIPTYNRRNLVVNSIKSALSFIGDDERYEIIVIDDASTDGTFSDINERFYTAIKDGYLKILRLNENSGVVAARNQGAKFASGRWLLILDSDNEIIPDKKLEFELTLFEAKCPFVLFRCVDDSGDLIGPANMTHVLNYESALNNNFPEFFGVCDRNIFLSEYSNLDVVALKRFESIAFFRILKNFKNFYISNLIMRKYFFQVADRLSSKKGIAKDANLLMQGHFIFLKEHWRAMSLKRLFVSLSAVGYYSLLNILNSLIK